MGLRVPEGDGSPQYRRDDARLGVRGSQWRQQRGLNDADGGGMGIESPRPSHPSRSNGRSLGACGYIWVRPIYISQVGLRSPSPRHPDRGGRGTTARLAERIACTSEKTKVNHYRPLADRKPRIIRSHLRSGTCGRGVRPSSRSSPQSTRSPDTGRRIRPNDRKQSEPSARGSLMNRGCSLRHGSILSGVGVSGNPGAFHCDAKPVHTKRVTQ